jgi:hypothetical protein
VCPPVGKYKATTGDESCGEHHFVCVAPLFVHGRVRLQAKFALIGGQQPFCLVCNGSLHFFSLYGGWAFVVFCSWNFGWP